MHRGVVRGVVTAVSWAAGHGRLHAEEATASPNQQAAATPPAAAEPRLTALNPVPTVGSAVSAVAKMFGAIDIAAARHPNSHPPAQGKSRKRKCSGRAK